MMYARGLNEREVHTRSWHYMHEWLEQYLRYDFLIPVPKSRIAVSSALGVQADESENQI
jgi:hypothetical protein